MNMLAVDTATDILSLALQTEAGIWYLEQDAGLHHSENLLPLIDQLLEQSKMQQQDIQLLACMKGPGSFTGLRIGYATVKGMALALGIPFIGIPTLDCIAETWQTWPGIIIPLIDAKKQCYFWAAYQRDQSAEPATCQRCTEYQDSPLSEVHTFLTTIPKNIPVLITGPDAARAKPELESYLQSRRTAVSLYFDPWGRRGKARELLANAEKQFTITKKGDDLSSGPLYLRKSDAEISKGL
ncbi:MAG: tRNA (adenosine(37)-N6)-threonylcarbamoyltransferase complex dimerization subunit type 1 TsaB [Termitinemataceae bacterium]